MTFNVWGKHRWPSREAPLRSFFKRAQPDVFVLQEVTQDILAVVDSEIKDTHSRIRDDEFEGWYCEGNIYWNHSMFTLKSHGYEDVGITSSKFRRLFWVLLQVNGTQKEVLISTAHLTYQQHKDEVETGQNPRLRQTQRVLEFLQTKSGPNNSTPIIFAGDVNDPIHPSLIMTKGGFPDVMDLLGQQKSYTWPWGFTLDEDEPKQCLDFVFCNADDSFRPVGAYVHRFQYKNFKEGEWPVPSDHYPVQAVFEIAASDLWNN